MLKLFAAKPKEYEFSGGALIYSLLMGKAYCLIELRPTDIYISVGRSPIIDGRRLYIIGDWVTLHTIYLSLPSWGGGADRESLLIVKGPSPPIFGRTTLMAHSVPSPYHSTAYNIPSPPIMGGV